MNYLLPIVFLVGFLGGCAPAEAIRTAGQFGDAGQAYVWELIGDREENRHQRRYLRDGRNRMCQDRFDEARVNDDWKSALAIYDECMKRLEEEYVTIEKAIQSLKTGKDPQARDILTGS